MPKPGRSGRQPIHANGTGGQDTREFRDFTYYQPTTPWPELSETERWQWFIEQDESYRRHVEDYAAIWSGDPNPAPEVVLTYLKKLGTWPCSCGYDGYPRSLHGLVYTCNPVAPEGAAVGDDDDDDIPF